MKAQIVIEGRKILATSFGNGRMHDYKLFKKSKTRFHKNKYVKVSLLEINETIFREYLTSLIERKVTSHYLWATHFQLSYFYRFAKLKNWIIVNPVGELSPSRPQAKLCVVVESDYKKLFTFIKATESDSESALILALILFFGLTNAELAHAQIHFGGSLHITLRRPRRTREKNSTIVNKSLNYPPFQIGFFISNAGFTTSGRNSAPKSKGPLPLAPSLLLQINSHLILSSPT